MFGRIVGQAAAAVLLAVVVLFGTAPGAAAKPDDPPTAAPKQSICATSGDGTADLQYLPVQRWSGATQHLHVRSNGGLIDFNPMQRQAQSAGFVIGDFLYSVTANFVTWSTEFCPLNAVGATIDSAAATFGDAVIGSPLLAAIVVITAVASLIQGVLGNRQWIRPLLARLGVLAILAILVLGAQESHTDKAGNFVPGRGSPGWFAMTIDQTITEIASTPAGAISVASGNEVVGVDQDQLSCGAYITALHRGYDASVRAGGATLAAKSGPAQTISNLWVVSGYRAWSVGQFGRENLNGQNRVACRMLDHNAAIPAGLESFTIEGQSALDRSTATRAGVLTHVTDPRISPMTEVAVNPKAAAWRPLNVVEQDKAWIAWAACVPKHGLVTNLDEPTGWHTPKGQSWLLAAESARKGADDGQSADLNRSCHRFFNEDSDKVDSIFDWDNGDGKLKEVAGEMPASIYDFISALHGTNQTAAGSAVIGYVISAIGVAGVFGSVGVVIMIVKAVAVFMLFSVILVAIFCLLPGFKPAQLGKIITSYIGLSVTAAFGVFILAMITLFTNAILNIIKGFAGANSDMTLVVGGLAPVMAAVALHLAFKRAGVPSPMTLKGALAWGGALAGGAGLAAFRAGSHRMYGAAAAVAGRSLGRRTDLSDGTRVSPKLGKRNNELGSLQKAGPVNRNRTAGGRSPEAILADPKATKAEKREAQRRRMADLAALREIKRAEKQADKEGRPSLGERAQNARGKIEDTVDFGRRGARALRDDFQADPGRAIGNLATGAGLVGARVADKAGAGVKHAASRTAAGVKNLGRRAAERGRIDAALWANSVRQNPVGALRTAGRTLIRGGAAAAAATALFGVAGAPILAVGAGAAAGIVAARGGKAVLARRARARREANQAALDEYRRRSLHQNQPASSGQDTAEAAAPVSNDPGTPVQIHRGRNAVWTAAPVNRKSRLGPRPRSGNIRSRRRR